MYAIYLNNSKEIIELLIKETSDLKFSLCQSIIFNKKKIVSVLFRYFFVEFYHEKCKINLLHLHYLYNFNDDDIKIFKDCKNKTFSKDKCVFGWIPFMYKNWGKRIRNFKYLSIFY